MSFLEQKMKEHLESFGTKSHEFFFDRTSVQIWHCSDCGPGHIAVVFHTQDISGIGYMQLKVPPSMPMFALHSELMIHIRRLLAEHATNTNTKEHQDEDETANELVYAELEKDAYLASGGKLS